MPHQDGADDKSATGIHPPVVVIQVKAEIDQNSNSDSTGNKPDRSLIKQIVSGFFVVYRATFIQLKRLDGRVFRVAINHKLLIGDSIQERLFAAIDPVVLFLGNSHG